MKKLCAIMAVLLLASCAGMGVREVEMTAADQKLSALTKLDPEIPTIYEGFYVVRDVESNWGVPTSHYILYKELLRGSLATNSKSSAYTVGADNYRECYGGLIYVTSDATITACDDLVSGMSFSVVAVGATTVTIDPQSDDLIVRDGTAQTDGVTIVGTGTAGDIAVCTYYPATGWSCVTNGWTQGS